MFALLSVSLTTVIRYSYSTGFLQLLIACALAYLFNPAVVFLRALSIYYPNSEFYRGTPCRAC